MRFVTVGLVAGLGVLVAMVGCSSSSATGGTTGPGVDSGKGGGTDSGKGSGSHDSGAHDSTTDDSGSDDSGSDDSGSDDDGNDSGFCAVAGSAGVAAGYSMVALACGQDTPSGIAVQNGIVYWTNYDAPMSSGNATGTGGAVMSVPTSGGTPTALIPNQDYPWAIAVDANNVYWTNYDNAGAVSGGETNSGSVLQAPIGGGTIITLQTGLEDPYGIAVDATNVYFTTYAGNRVKKVPIGGGAVVVLAEGLSNPCYVTVSGGNVYWTNYGDGTVQTIATSGTGPGTPTVLSTDSAGDNANGIAVSGSSVFFAASNDPGAIWSVATAGGTATPIAGQQDDAWGLATDGTNVYWTTNDDPGGLSMVPIGGGTVTSLATGLEDPTAIAVDSTGVYTAGEGGHIWRITKN